MCTYLEKVVDVFVQYVLVFCSNYEAVITQLHTASEEGHLEKATRLIEQGFDVNATDRLVQKEAVRSHKIRTVVRLGDLKWICLLL